MAIHHFNRETPGDASAETLWCPLEGAGVFSDAEGCCDSCGSDLIQPVVLAAIRAEAYAQETVQHVAAAEAAVRAEKEIARLRAELVTASEVVIDMAVRRAKLAEQEKTIDALVDAGEELDWALRALTALRADDGVRANWWRVVAAAKGTK